MRTIAWGACLVAVLVVFTATPALAHGGLASDEPPASNWRTRISAFPTPVDGLTLETVDGGEQLQLTNASPQTVTVFGYENEPYLRIGPGGVFENRRSPATYLNASASGSNEVPDQADAKAEPDWQRASSATRFKWHDHRAHWMAGEPPPAVQQDPGTERVVIERWSIPLEVESRRFEASGDLTWIPAPPAWPWLVGIVGLATGLVAAAFSSRWRAALVTAVVLVVATSSLDVVGTWGASSDPPLQRAANLVTPVLAFGFFAAGLWLLDRRRDDALLLVFGGAAGVAVFFGWVSRGFLTSSQIPSTLPAPIARMSVTAALGIGVGLMSLVVVFNRAKLFSLATREEGTGPHDLSRRQIRGSGAQSDDGRRRTVVFAASAIGGIVIIIAVAVLAGRSPQRAAAPPQAATAFVDVGAGLCAAIDAAAKNDTNGARRAFDEIHAHLHTIAEEETDRDRSRAARFLEAKQRVENDLATSPTTLEADLRSLHTISSTITPPATPAGRC